MIFRGKKCCSMITWQKMQRHAHKQYQHTTLRSNYPPLWGIWRLLIWNVNNPDSDINRYRRTSAGHSISRKGVRSFCTIKVRCSFLNTFLSLHHWAHVFNYCSKGKIYFVHMWQRKIRFFKFQCMVIYQEKLTIIQQLLDVRMKGESC